MRRSFWVAFGMGLGAATAILGTRWTRRQVEKAKPKAIAREAKGGILDLTKLVAASIDEGKRAMDEREAELRARKDAAKDAARPGAASPGAASPGAA